MQNLATYNQEELTKRLATLKGKTARQCENCGRWVVIGDSRLKTVLCSKCEAGRSVIQGYKDSHKIEKLALSDWKKIGREKTLRKGPFYRQKSP